MAGNSGEEVFEADAYDPDDVLMAAIVGEGVPDEVAAGPGYRAALDDLDQLRFVLRELGDELAAEPVAEREPAKDPLPVRPARVRGRRLFTVSVRVAAVACAFSAVGWLFWAGANNGFGGGANDADAGKAGAPAFSDEDRSSDQKGDGSESASRAPSSGAAKDQVPYSRAEEIACTKILVEGKVAALVPREDGRVGVTVAVDRWYRPEQPTSAQPRTTVALPVSDASDIETGELVLISVYRHAEDGYGVQTGRAVSEALPELLAALPESRSLDCPVPLKEQAP